MSEAAKMRMERIERLLSELEYEITRGVMEREIEPDIHMSRVFPCRGRGNDLAQLEIHVSAVTQSYVAPAMSIRPRLRVVEQNGTET